MRTEAMLLLLNASLLLAGGVYLVRLGHGIERELRSLSVELSARTATQSVAGNAAGLTAEAVQEAARRGALRALANSQAEVRPPECPQPEAKAVDAVPAEPSPPSTEAIRAYDEANLIVSSGLERKLWTLHDAEELQAYLPLLDAASRDELLRRLIQAVNAQQLNVSATRGQLF